MTRPEVLRRPVIRTESPSRLSAVSETAAFEFAGRETWLASQGLGGLKWIYGLDRKPFTRLRNLGMKIVDETPWLKRELMRKAVHNLT